MANVLRQVQEWAGGLLLLAILADVLLQVITRQFGGSLTFTEESARYLMIWMGFVGIAAATYANAHMRVAFLADKTPLRWRPYVVICARLLFLAYVLLLGYSGALLTQLQWTMGRRWSTLDIPVWIVNIVVPIGMVLTAIAIIQTWRAYRGPAA
ncbi:MAG TPA: TRAP transporter small permease subunit [Casimicrobiaceae bacterium]